MGKIYNSSQVCVEFSPWTDDHKFRITRLQMCEKLGGEIAHGEIDLFHTDERGSSVLITEQNTGTITFTDEKPGGLTYTVDIYITEREFYRNVVNLKFVCIPDIEFYTKRITTYYYKSIPLKDKIRALYPGKVDFRDNDPDVPDITIFQNCETNYELCRRLCYSFKDKTIFTFGWDGLILKEICGLKDHEGNVEPKLELEANRLTKQFEPYNLAYDKLQNHLPYDPWPGPDESTTKTDYSGYMSKYFRVQMNYQEYNVVDTEHDPYMMNVWRNTRRMEFPGYTHFTIVATDMPHYKIGDVLIYDRAEQEEKIPWKYYLVTSNEIFYTVDASEKHDENGFKFSWTSHFYGIEDGTFSQQP